MRNQIVKEYRTNPSSVYRKSDISDLTSGILNYRGNQKFSSTSDLNWLNEDNELPK